VGFLSPEKESVMTRSVLSILARAALVACVIVISAAVTASYAKKSPKKEPRFASHPNRNISLPRDLIGFASGPLRSAAALDTFVLHSADFTGGGGMPNPMGYSSVDMTDQMAVFFHVADSTELDGGESGHLQPLSGRRSMWCGLSPTTVGPFCRYATLPGYADNWNQIVISDPLDGDSANVTYKVFFDSELSYDETGLQYSFDGGASWTQVAVTDTFGTQRGVYDGTLPVPSITESFSFGSSGADDVRVRFFFYSDGTWSDEDGLYQSDGAVTLDDITIQTWNGGVPSQTNTETFETSTPGAHTAGIWSGSKPVSYGDYAELYPSALILQEDPCLFLASIVWGFFDDPLNTAYLCHTPDPRPDVGAIPFAKPGETITVGHWKSTRALYMNNEIWSPRFANTGQGDQYQLRFRYYRDLPLDNLHFVLWKVRSWRDGCPGDWESNNFVEYGSDKDWHTYVTDVGAFIDPEADEIQIAIGSLDLCPFWCNIYGTASCHSHAPLIDNIQLTRIENFGAQITVQHTALFQDNFAEDGTLTGTARADAAMDLTGSWNPGVVPGDSVPVTISPMGTDASTGVGPAAYAYVALWPPGQPEKTPEDMEAPETRSGVGKRWPLVATRVIQGVTWACFRMDSAADPNSYIPTDRYCFDLNDNLFTPGDTIAYFFCADEDGVANNGNETYWHRTAGGQGWEQMTNEIEEAAASPCEFTILPAGGFNNGGDILYVDDADDRGGPLQLYFDSAFRILGIDDQVDRFDVLGPSSSDGNSLSSRVKSNIEQIVNVYRTIIWSSGNLERGTIGDGTGSPEKSDDFALLYQWLDVSFKGPGLYISGDHVATEWRGTAANGAVALRTKYLSFGTFGGRGDHVFHGEAVSPTLTAVGSSFIHQGIPDQLIVYGGCPVIDAFDVLEPTGAAQIEFPYPVSGDGAVISQTTTNMASTPATVVLSGFSYDNIHNVTVGFPPARVEHLRDILTKFGNAVPQPTGVEPDLPQHVNALDLNYPNPFNPVTTIKYSIRERAHVSLRIYNAAGQLVKTLVDEVQSPDEVRPQEWDGRSDAGQIVASGVYFYRLVTKDFVQTKKMVLLK